MRDRRSMCFDHSRCTRWISPLERFPTMSTSLIGCHALVWTGTFDPAGIRLSVAKTKQAGFDLVEFPLMDPFTFDTEVAGAALAEHGLSASASLGLSEGT